MLKAFILTAALLVGGTTSAHWWGGYTEYVRCESYDHRPNICGTYNIRRVEYVRLVQQHSKTYCQRGHNWRPTRWGVEVWGGCRATFAISGW
jgi:hypothetical protein